jgi:hypothetical protein
MRLPSAARMAFKSGVGAAMMSALGDEPVRQVRIGRRRQIRDKRIMYHS